MKRTITRELKLGIIVIGAGLLLYFGLNFLKGINIFSSVKNYYVQYDNIGGLVASSPVNLKGYKVGQVDDIQYDFSKETPFVVTISIKKDIVLPHGTQIALYDDGIMGGKAIQVILPTNNTPTAYQDGDTLPAQVIPGLIDQLTMELLPKIQSISVQADSLIIALRNTIENENVTNALGRLDEISKDLAATSAHANKIMGENIPGILNKVDVVANDFITVSSNLKSIDYAATFSNIDQTISHLNSVAAKIDTTGGTLGALLNDDQLYFKVLDTASSADSLLLDLKKNPKRYVHFSIFGRK